MGIMPVNGPTIKGPKAEPSGELSMNLKFCDLMCKYARSPEQEAIDGAGSCMTFSALYCDLKKSLVHKNLPCKRKVRKREPSIISK
jgi:hypothetical protein